MELTIDLAQPHLIADLPIRVVLVGCGGTGSHIAQSLARIAYHAHQVAGPNLSLIFLDGDAIEAKNVGRQLFSPSEIGRNKAQSLAARFNAALGLQITAIPQMADAALIESLVGIRQITLFVGAVDTVAARQAIAEVMRVRTVGSIYWLDCGNDESSGQVAIGNADFRTLPKAFDLPGICAALPIPPLVYPDLVAAPKAKQGIDLACAEAQIDGAQSLMVNQAMAAVAGEYLYNMLVRRRLTTFATSIDLGGLSMRSLPTTKAAIQAACKLPANFFAVDRQPKRAKKAKRAQ